MKKFKLGFTLAEVLITLGIIGVVAAIVMPTVMTSYQYKSIGVQLAKFAQQTENAARAYVAINDSLSNEWDDFVEETFVITSGGFDEGDDGAYLKDGTKITIDDAGDNDAAAGIQDAAGTPIKKITFTSSATGLKQNAQKEFDFVMTELGYIFPLEDDECLVNIVAVNYNTTRKFYEDEDNSCMGDAE